MSALDVFLYLFVGAVLVVAAAMVVVVGFFALSWVWKKLW